MGEELKANLESRHSDEAEEAVLVEPQEFSEDDENLVDAEVDEDPQVVAYDDDEEEDQEFEDDEEDDDDMSVGKVGLHNINTLRQLYRLRLINPPGICILW